MEGSTGPSAVAKDLKSNNWGKRLLLGRARCVPGELGAVSRKCLWYSAAWGNKP